jgi:hypothetical protein
MLRGYHAAFLTGACLVFFAALSGLLIHDEDAASTLRGRTGSDEPALAAAGD